jgi:hypothetical protein
MRRCVHRRNAATVTRQQRSADVAAALVQILREIAERLWCVAKAVQEQNRSLAAGAQVDRTGARD